MSNQIPSPFIGALLVACGGAAGALSRWAVTMALHGQSGRAGHWATLAINLTGCFLIGVARGLADRLGAPGWIMLALGTGFLGAFTTFSTFGLEVAGLLRAGDARAAGLYVVLSVAGGVTFVAAGDALARQLSSGR